MPQTINEEKVKEVQERVQKAFRAMNVADNLAYAFDSITHENEAEQIALHEAIQKFAAGEIDERGVKEAIGALRQKSLVSVLDGVFRVVEPTKSDFERFKRLFALDAVNRVLDGEKDELARLTRLKSCIVALFERRKQEFERQSVDYSILLKAAMQVKAVFALCKKAKMPVSKEESEMLEKVKRLDFDELKIEYGKPLEDVDASEFILEKDYFTEAEQIPAMPEMMQQFAKDFNVEFVDVTEQVITKEQLDAPLSESNFKEVEMTQTLPDLNAMTTEEINEMPIDDFIDALTAEKPADDIESAFEHAIEKLDGEEEMKNHSPLFEHLAKNERNDVPTVPPVAPNEIRISQNKNDAPKYEAGEVFKSSFVAMILQEFERRNLRREDLLRFLPFVQILIRLDDDKISEAELAKLKSIFAEHDINLDAPLIYDKDFTLGKDESNGRFDLTFEPLPEIQERDGKVVMIEREATPVHEFIDTKRIVFERVKDETQEVEALTEDEKQLAGYVEDDGSINDFEEEEPEQGNLFGDIFDVPKVQRKKMFTSETMIETAFKYHREQGFPYREVSPAMAQVELQKLAETEGDALINTRLGYQVADHFHRHRFHASANKMKSPFDSFHDDKKLRKAIRLELQLGKKPRVWAGGMMTLVNGTQACSNFRPGFAAYLYRKYAPDDAVVLDTSTGYGGRLLGAVASQKVKKYIGVDPNVPTFQANCKMIKELRLDTLLEFELINLPAEDVDAESLREQCDFSFTSPPYFAKEIYSQDETQSWKRYKTGESWRDNFLKKMLELTYTALKFDCFAIVNIADVQLQKKKYPLAQWTVELGQAVGFTYVETAKFPMMTRFGKGMNKDEVAFEPVIIFKKEKK